jgi:hypothetical protein
MAVSEAAVKKVAALNEVLNAGVRAQVKKNVEEKTDDSATVNIKSNTFFQIMFSDKLSLEQKKVEVAKALTFSGDKEKDRTRVKEFEEFKEYLQSVREDMAKKIIKLTDTEAFSELKQVYQDLNGSLLDFDEKMAPLTEIIDAVYKLRTEGLVFDTFKEIEEDKKREIEVKAKRDAISRETSNKMYEIQNLNRKIENLNEKKTLFGFGGLSASTKAEIGDAEFKISQLNDEIKKSQVEIQELNKAAQDQGKFAAEKLSCVSFLISLPMSTRSARRDLLKPH